MAAGHLSVIWCPITKWQELSFLFVCFFFCLILFHLWASSKECAFLFLGSSRRDSCASHTSPWASLIRRKSWLVGREPNGSAERASWWWKEGYFHSSFDSLNVISERVLVMYLFGLERSGMIFFLTNHWASECGQLKSDVHFRHTWNWICVAVVSISCRKCMMRVPKRNGEGFFI